MTDSSLAFSETKVYRLSRIYQVYHFAVGIIAIVGAVKSYSFFALSVALVIFGAFMIARPFIMAVTIDQYSVTCKGTFSENSMLRSAITSIETKATGKGDILILWGDPEEKEKLEIPDLFGFDDDWENWLHTYRDLSDDKPLSIL